MSSMPPPPSPYGQNAGQPGPLNPNDEKTWALGTHLLCLVASFIAPLIVWLVFKGRGPFLEHHAKEALNFQITVLIAVIVSSLLMLALIGFLLLPLVGLWALIMPIIAAVKASNGQWYRYPLTVRFIS